jgi:hypothetical protein
MNRSLLLSTFSPSGLEIYTYITHTHTHLTIDDSRLSLWGAVVMVWYWYDTTYDTILRRTSLFISLAGWLGWVGGDGRLFVSNDRDFFVPKKTPGTNDACVTWLLDYGYFLVESKHKCWSRRGESSSNSNNCNNNKAFDLI